MIHQKQLSVSANRELQLLPPSPSASALKKSSLSLAKGVHSGNGKAKLFALCK